jgi:Uma2 family endonuclease
MSHQPFTVESAVPTVLALNVHSMHLTDEQFEKLCRENPELRIELTSRGELIIMPPTGMKTGWRNSKLTQRLGEWTERDGSGLSFDSSTLFTLPDGSKRSPDASWIRGGKWEALTDEQKQSSATMAPDFVIELRSPSDSWPLLKEKMLDYISHGVLLGWLIDPERKRVYVYRPEQPVETLDDPATLVGDPLLPGFIFNPQEIW